MYNSSIYPVKINKYQPPQNKPVQNNEEQGQSGTSTKQEQKEKSYNTIYKPTPGYYGNAAFNKFTVQKNIQPQISNLPEQKTPQNTAQQQASTMQGSTGMVRQSFPNGEKTAIDYTQSKINISQVIKDFKNTTEAIGSPDDIKDTVYTYITLVQKEAEKDNPNKKIIQSNLKNASQVLDEYITDTLKKQSNVVEGWIDSLFLQNVDYKYDESIINPDYQINIPDKNKKTTTVNNNSDQTGQTTSTSYEKPAGEHVRNPFFESLVSAKKEKNPAEALNMYSEIIENAANENDKKAVSIAYFESGKLYDSFNSFEKAIENYSSAIENSNDDGMKAQAYMKIAQIYHDSADIQEAGDNYFSSIGYFGQLDNTKAQAVLLSQTGKLVSENFDKKNAQDYFYVASALAEDLGDKRLSGKIKQKAGEAFTYMNEPRKALDYYKESASSFDAVQNNTELAKDYQAAANLMIELGNPAKARTLLNKAFKAGIRAEDQELTRQIQAQIAVLS